MGLTDNQIQIKLNTLEKSISNIQNALNIMQDDIDSRIHLSELVSLKTELKNLINDNGELIVDIQRRLAQIKLPEESQYFLEEGDVESFKNNFSALKAMLSRFERLYNNLVSYTTQLSQ